MGQPLVERTAGIGTGLATEDMVLNIGPQHPATHGVLRLRLVLDGERIVEAEPIIGYMHRGAEKLFEVRDYRQIIVLANRHDWLSAFSNELGVVLAAERMLGMEVPVRAVWARTMLAELNRVLSHLMFLGSYPLELGAITPIFYAFREREDDPEGDGGDLRRAHALHVQPGRRPQGGPAGRLAGPGQGGDRTPCAGGWPTSRPIIHGNEIFHARTRGVGLMTPEQVAAYGVSRPDRARLRSRPRPAPRRPVPGVRRAGRRAEGGHPHRRGLLRPLRVPARADVQARSTSPRPASTGSPRCRPGPINLRLPKVLKVPEGETYAWTENPLGINGYYLVSRGDKTPWRLKLRSASFNNVQVLGELLPGNLVADMVAILGSMFFVVGDIDK